MGQSIGKGVAYTEIKTKVEHCIYCDTILTQGTAHTYQKCIAALREKSIQAYDNNGHRIDQDEIKKKIDLFTPILRKAEKNEKLFTPRSDVGELTLHREAVLLKKQEAFMNEYMTTDPNDETKRSLKSGCNIDEIISIVHNGLKAKHPDITIEDSVACFLLYYQEHIDAKY